MNNENFIAKSFIDSSINNSERIYPILYSFVVSNKTYDETLKDATKKLGITEEAYHRDMKELFTIKGIVMTEDKYIKNLKNKVLTPRPCIASYLMLLGFNKNSEGFKYISLAVLDGNNRGGKETCIKEASEVFGVTEDVFKSKIKECLDTVEETKGMDAADGIAYVRNKLIKPTEQIVNRIIEGGVPSDSNALNYLSTMVKLIMLGNKVYNVYNLEASMLHGVLLRTFSSGVREAVVTSENGDCDKNVFEFLKGVCYSLWE